MLIYKYVAACIQYLRTFNFFQHIFVAGGTGNVPGTESSVERLQYVRGEGGLDEFSGLKWEPAGKLSIARYFIRGHTYAASLSHLRTAESAAVRRFVLLNLKETSPQMERGRSTDKHTR